jgi:hypothetical protein
MRKYLVLLSVLISTMVNAQVFQFETMGITKEKKPLYDVTFFDNNFYGLELHARAKFGWTMTLQKTKMECTLLSYDNKLNLVKENILAQGKEAFGPLPPFFKVINQKLYLVYFNYDNDVGIEVFTARIDRTSLALSEIKKVLTVDQSNLWVFQIAGLYSSYNLTITASPDQSKLLFFWTSGISNAYSYSITDSDMNITRKGGQELATIKEFTITNMLMDNSGYFIGGLQYKEYDNYHSFLLSVTPEGEVQTFEPELDGTSPHDIYVAKGSTDDQVKVFGTSSREGTYITGTFYQNMDKKSFKASDLVMKDIPPGLVIKFGHYSNTKTNKKGYGLFPEVQFVDFAMDDGSIILAGDLTRYVSGGNSPSYPVKGSSLIIIFNSNHDIVITWLPKKELLEMKKGNNFFAHKHGANLMLFYTDLESNVNAPFDQAETIFYASKKNNVFVVATIEKDGSISRQILHSATADPYYFSPGSLSSLDDNTLLVGPKIFRNGINSLNTTHEFLMLKIADE